MNRNLVLAIVVIIVIVFAGMWFLSNHTVNAPTTDTTPQPTAATQQTATPSASDSAMQGTVKEFTVTGSNFSFSPATLTVNKGDTVKITFKNSGGSHNFTLSGFSVATKTIQSGESDSVTFTADKTGSFEYFCSVGNHRSQGMKGMLTVQ